MIPGLRQRQDGRWRGSFLTEIRRVAAEEQVKRGEPAAPAPVITSADPATMDDRTAEQVILLTGTGLDDGAATVEDNEVGAGALTIDLVTVTSDTSVDLTVTSTNGVTTIGVHTLTFTNDSGSEEFDIEVTDG